MGQLQHCFIIESGRILISIRSISNLFYMRLFYIIIFLHSFMISDAQLDWKDTQGPEGGAFLELYVHGDSTYAASYRSVYKYVNDSLQWKEIAQGNFHEVKSSGDKAFSYFRINEDKYLFAFSNDKSRSWDTLSIMEEDSIYIEDIALDSKYYYVLISDRRIRRDFLLRTTETKVRWDTISTIPSMWSIDVFKQRFYLQTYDSLLYSDDHGDRYSKVNLPIDRLSGSVVVAKDNNIGIAADDRLYFSRDLGQTWEEVPGDYDSNPPHITITKDNDLYAKYYDRLIRVHNFGDSISWHSLDYKNITGFSLAPLGETVITNNWIIGIYKWSHKEKKFIPSYRGIKEGWVSDMDTIGNMLYTSGMSGIYRYDMTSGEWSENLFPYYILQSSYIETNSRGWILLGFGWNSHFYLSKDFGTNWKKYNPNYSRFGHIHKPYLLVDTVLFRPGSSGRLIRSTDPFKTDSLMEDVIVHKHGVQNVSGQLYSSYDSTLFFSLDTGLSWTKRKMNFRINYLYTSKNYIFLSTRNPDRTQKIYYLDQDHKIINELNLPDTYYYDDPSFVFFEDNGALFISVRGKIYRTTDFGEHWELYSGDNPSTFVFKVDSLLFASDNGIFRTALSRISSNVRPHLPYENVTYKCFPNPSEGKLNIEFDHFPLETIQLQIVSLSGQLVYQKELKAYTSTHSVEISSIPSGSYFLLLSNEKFRLPASKLIILNR